jgi:FAD/FMN-containing dehydrogenase
VACAKRTLVADASELEAFNVDWMGKYRGASRVALKPKTTAQVAAVLAHCNARHLAVVPQASTARPHAYTQRAA